jgi:serine phosphatase RsbU (regulator of sigma subunit)/predicted negative regulator of RcsB-dependent stress response
MLNTALNTTFNTASRLPLCVALLACLFCLPPSVRGQHSDTQRRIDSLEALLAHVREKQTSLAESRTDTTLVHLLNTVSREYFKQNPAKSLSYAQQAVDVAVKLSNGEASQQWTAQSLSNAGVALYYQGKYDEALMRHFEALKIREAQADKRGQAISLNNIGLVYYDQNKYDLALVQHFKALRLREEAGDKQGQSSSLSNIGLIYSEQLQFDSARTYFLQALRIFREIGDKQGEASLLNNIGRIYTTQGNLQEALQCYRESLALKRLLGNKEGECASLNNIGNLLNMQGSNREALEYSQQALALADSIGAKVRQQEALETLSTIYADLGDNKSALEYFRRSVAVRDEILNEQSQSKTLQLQAQYESEKKDQAIKLLSAETQLQATVRNVLIAGGVLLVGMLVLAVNRYRTKQRANEEIMRQKQVVEQQAASIRRANEELAERNHELDSKNHELDEKNHEIMDSIFYAERIQRAVLPAEIRVVPPIAEQFIVSKPRDIVSGDFYWAHTIETPNYGILSFVAAVDCTGHGVPGAFMSMIGNTLLNQIVLERHIHDPAHILEELHLAVRRALKQDEEEDEDERSSQDGMDVCLCRIEPGKLIFAGAKRPLYIVRPSVDGVECEEIKGNKGSIGGKQREERRTFTNHELPITQPVTVYLTTDGFADQPNAALEKFGSRRLRALLAEMAIFPARRQRQSFLSELKEFQAGAAQRDDITIIGLKLQPSKHATSTEATVTASAPVDDDLTDRLIARINAVRAGSSKD